MQLFISSNIAAASNGSAFTITAAGATFIGGCLFEVHGLANWPKVVDQAASLDTTSSVTTLLSPTIQGTTKPELIISVSACQNTGNATAAEGSYTFNPIDGPDNDGVGGCPAGYLITSAIGSYTAGLVQSPAGSGVVGIASMAAGAQKTGTSPTASPTGTPTPTPSATPTDTATPRPTASPNPTATASPRESPTGTPARTPSATPSPTASPSPTATPSGGQISPVGGASATNPGGSSLTINVPSGTVNGDVMIAVVGWYTATSITPPSGWTLIATQPDGEGVGYNSSYYRVAASEPANYTWNWSGTSYPAGIIYTFSGVNTSTPIDVSQVESGTSTSPTASSVTTTVSNDYLITTFEFNGGGTFTVPSGMAGGGSITYSYGDNFGVNLDYKALGSAGSTGAQTGSLTSSAEWGSQTIALKPASSSPTPTPTPTATPSGGRISPVGGASATNPGGSSLTINVPSGTVNGDVMIAVVGWYTATSITPPSGWTLIATQPDGEGIGYNGSYYRVATNEPANYTWNWSGTSYPAGIIYTFSGVNTSTPIDVSQVESGTSTLPTAPSVTTRVSNDYLITTFEFNGGGTFTVPSGMAGGGSITYSYGDNFGVNLDYKALGSAGSTGAQTGSLTSSAEWGSQTIALKPASSSPTPTPTPTATPSGGQISPVGGASATNPGGSSLTINVPSGTVNGDVMIAVLAWYTATSITPPSGWTLIATQPDGEGIGYNSSYYRVAASEPANYTWNWSGTSYPAGIIYTFSGVNTSTPIDVSQVESGTSTLPTAPSVTTRVSNDYLINTFEFNGGSAFTIPSGMTSGGNIPYSFGANFGVNLDYKALGSAGSTGAQTGSLTSSAEWGSQTVALEP